MVGVVRLVTDGCGLISDGCYKYRTTIACVMKL